MINGISLHPNLIQALYGTVYHSLPKEFILQLNSSIHFFNTGQLIKNENKKSSIFKPLIGLGIGGVLIYAYRKVSFSFFSLFKSSAFWQTMIGVSTFIVLCGWMRQRYVNLSMSTQQHKAITELKLYQPNLQWSAYQYICKKRNLIAITSEEFKKIINSKELSTLIEIIKEEIIYQISSKINPHEHNLNHITHQTSLKILEQFDTLKPSSNPLYKLPSTPYTPLDKVKSSPIPCKLNQVKRQLFLPKSLKLMRKDFFKRLSS